MTGVVGDSVADTMDVAHPSLIAVLQPLTA